MSRIVINDDGTPEEIEESPGLENEDYLPLFPDADKDPQKVATGIKVYKTDEPNSGYKGLLPPTATEHDISVQFGNGFYKLEAVSENGKILRRRNNVKIDVQQPKNAPKPDDEQDFNKRVLGHVFARADNDIKRMELMQRDNVTIAREQSREFVGMVSKQSSDTLEQNRHFYTAQGNQMSQFFGAMLMQQQQMHAQTMQMMIAMQQNNNPQLMIATLIKGLEMGRDMGGEMDPQLELVKTGVEGIKQLGVLASESNKQQRTLPANTQSSGTKPPANGGLAKLGNASNPQPNGTPKKKLPFDKAEFDAFLALKKVADEKGIDLAEVMRDAAKHYQAEEAPEESGGVEVDNDASESESRNSAEGLPESG